MVTAAYSGTFDPITLGHYDIIERASRMYERLIVAVGLNPAKNPRFTLDERVALIREVVKDLDNVEVIGFSGLVVDFARDNHVTVLVRGVRTVGDFDYEKQMAVMNRDLYPQLDTVMFTPSPEYAHLSSSLVRELASLGAPVEKLVPAAVMPALQKRVGSK
ncbi:pantetheine-phosphate adenylyltransferase [Sinimarinibacterium sp. CAU 1509]|uniref:pantetheine-phosphate adenylyltransferase n=1 Tax=Sinimarinibacterium sp. CAU 1509 TaxID=2562283 RepID=UPI0010ABF7D3|nr:pantetheine-phosphate adenylyltransferase [Sinimarinibacterium sp. CAU 1509]TJY56759.1 pantetheine-phosphate adenylyltransferase [Sinimarinibacterium sp. CAU 1509]